MSTYRKTTEDSEYDSLDSGATIGDSLQHEYFDTHLHLEELPYVYDEVPLNGILQDHYSKAYLVAMKGFHGPTNKTMYYTYVNLYLNKYNVFPMKDIGT